MDNDDVFHAISRAEAWRKVEEISRTVHDIRTDQILLKSEVKKDGEKVLTTLQDHTGRLRALDMKFYGVVAGLLGGYGYLIFGG